MAKDTKKPEGDFLAKFAETQAALAKKLTDESHIIDGTAVLESLLGGNEGLVMERVIKLVGTQDNLFPAIQGKFMGYEPVLVRKPGAKEGEEKQLMSFILLESNRAPGVIAKLLGSSQVMQGLASVPMDGEVTIIRPHRMQADGKVVPEYIEIAGGRRVGVWHVVSKQSGRRGSSTPFGEMGKQLAATRAVGALPAGETVNQSGETVDETTGEVKG